MSYCHLSKTFRLKVIEKTSFKSITNDQTWFNVFHPSSTLQTPISLLQKADRYIKYWSLFCEFSFSAANMLPELVTVMQNTSINDIPFPQAFRMCLNFQFYFYMTPRHLFSYVSTCLRWCFHLTTWQLFNLILLQDPSVPESDITVNFPLLYLIPVLIRSSDSLDSEISFKDQHKTVLNIINLVKLKSIICEVNND